MDTVLSESNSLSISRFHAQYLVSLDHSSPETVKAKLDEVIIKHLSVALSTLMRHWFQTQGSTVLLIRSLEIKAYVNVAWEQEQIARQLATQIARSLDMALQGGSAATGVLRFASWAAYLAQFLMDLAQGCAWGKWYYEEFEGLRMLPVSSALRTVICDQPATALAALLHHSSHELTKIIRALTASDARRILENLTADGHNGDADRCLEAVWKVWETTPLGPLQAADEWQNTLHLYLTTCHEQPELSGVTLQVTVRAVLCLARHLASDEGKTVLAALSSGQMSSLYTTVGTGNAEILLPLLHCARDRVKEVGQALFELYTGQVTNASMATDVHRYTAFGSLFLLLPLLNALPLEEVTHDWPHTEDTSPVALVRFLLFIKCCGQANAQRVFFDPLVRDLMDIDPALSPLAVTHWQKGISRAKQETLLKRLATWQDENGATGGETLALLPAAASGGTIAVLLDCRRGIWLTAQSYQRNRLDRLVARLRGWLATLDADEAVLFSTDFFAEALRPAFPLLKIEELAGPAAIQQVGEDAGLKEIMMRLDKLRSEVSYLSLPASFRLSRSFDLALSVAAQGVMRTFAWRLPGFASSSLPYLFANFLDVSASLEEEPERRVVRVGRPLLNLVLRITGMAHKTYSVSWLDERPFVLFQEE